MSSLKRAGRAKDVDQGRRHNQGDGGQQRGQQGDELCCHNLSLWHKTVEQIGRPITRKGMVHRQPDMVDAVKQRGGIVVRPLTAVQITGDRLYADQDQPIDLCLGQTGRLVAQPVKEVIGAGRYPQLAQLRQRRPDTANFLYGISDILLGSCQISPVVLVGYEQGIELSAIDGIQLLDDGEDFFWCHSRMIALFCCNSKDIPMNYLCTLSVPSLISCHSRSSLL